MGKQIWDIWPELTFEDVTTGTVYIQTPDEKWADYLSVWRRSIKEDVPGCPCPMPFGHLMFHKIKAPPRKEQKQRELF